MRKREYILSNASGFDSVKLCKSSTIPPLYPGEVQIKFHACSLNYRDLTISKGSYPLPTKPNIVPLSDGAGEIVAVGEGVTDFKVGDRVSPNFTPGHTGGLVTEKFFSTTLGAGSDGCLRQYGNFRASSCVKIPSTLSYEEAATLPCAALTAWSALYGMPGKELKPGQTVLAQGTGGVSVFAAQFALAAGAKVILTSSSDKKIAVVKQHLGEKNVLTINYSEVPEWGKQAKQLTNGQGVDHVIEIGGQKTLKQSTEALAMNGVIHFIGAVSGRECTDMNAMELAASMAIKNACIRGVLVGSVEQFKAMNAAIEANNIKPIIDKVFQFENVKAAYEYQWSQQHIGKVVIRIPQ